MTTEKLVVYPLADLDTLTLSRVKEDLRDDYHLVVGDREATETLVNKRKFYQALSASSIDYPATFFPQDLASARRIGKDLIYPVFVRPSITQLFSRIFGACKGFIAKSLEELLYYYRLASSKGVEVMFQEIIYGPPHNSFQIEGYFNKSFACTGFFARQRLRIWPPDFGNTTLCASIPISRLSFESEQMAVFLKKIRYNGLASAELKKDCRDGKNRMLEINARPWLHFWLSTECGNDILLSSYLDAIGEKTGYTQGYCVGTKSIDIERDLLAAPSMFKRGELSFLEWLSSLRRVRKSAVFEKTDLFPFFANWLRKTITFYGSCAGALFLSNGKRCITKPCSKCAKELTENGFSYCPSCGLTYNSEEIVEIPLASIRRRKKHA